MFYIRRLYKVGGRDYKSTVVVIPQEVLVEAGLESGDYVKISTSEHDVLIEPIDKSRGASA
ncbi:MAG: AbrB/MazE/SpoVT family DNA-binding domain-containing protein [Thaumarchaeota archaeon]|nr:AbrB/MazE/SpoVT family DNA-binding domain-containing protein [Nitrososphaerota archaeon]